MLVTGVDVVHRAGTWAALAFLLGGLLTLIFTLSQAELGAAFPLAGGDYATIGNALGPRAGFIQFGLVLFGTPIFLALSAVGVSLYVRSLAPGLPATGTALAALAASAAIAVLNIRTGAKLTGAFLAVELGALALLTLLGIAHPVQSLSALVTAPVAAGPGGLVTPTLGAIVLAIVAASYATAGAGQAIYFSEEMHNPASVGRLVMIIAVLTVLLEVLPVLGLVLGADNLPLVLGAESPFSAFMAERGSTLMATLVTLGIIAALFNAIVSGVTCYGRFLYSTGRDRIWSGGMNRATRALASAVGIAVGRDAHGGGIRGGILRSSARRDRAADLVYDARHVGAPQRGLHRRAQARHNRDVRALSRSAVSSASGHQPVGGRRADGARLERSCERTPGRDRRHRGGRGFVALSRVRSRAARRWMDALRCADGGESDLAEYEGD